MILKIFLLFVNVYFVRSRSRAPVPETVWRQHCTKNSLALNDCNWCRCDERLQYSCTARICSNVDMFGHFNDAIKEVDVGMEGKGYWRSLNTACEAGVYYRKGELLCVCNEDSRWPNPVCRDTFQVLHSVQATKYEKPKNQSCTATKLYQIGCNVCYCPSSEKIVAEFCTQRKCDNDISDTKDQKNTAKKDVLDEVYAECERAKQYKIGCKTCVCLPNNRLLCDNCTSIDDGKAKLQLLQPNNLCSGKKPGEYFKKDCNTCHCDQKDVIYCTVKKCIQDNTKISIPDINYETVDAPVDDNDCIPATKYNRDCNTCHCFMLDGIKYFGCTLKFCEKAKSTKNSTNCCVVGTKYEKNCLICHCVKEKGVKQEICTFNEECKLDNKVNYRATQSLDTLHGYCEPLHIYDQDCNKCRCLTDGKTVGCTSKICPKKPIEQRKAVVVEIIPFFQKNNNCPKGHRYKLNCNICQCMSNGNAICTTNRCSSNSLKLFDDYVLILI